MESVIIPIALGLFIVVLGILNFKGNINSIHYYHRKRVTEENKGIFAKLMGVGTILCGVGVVAFGVFSYISETTNGPLYTAIGSWCVIVCLVVGLLISFYAMIKYNKGIF